MRHDQAKPCPSCIKRDRVAGAEIVRLKQDVARHTKDACDMAMAFNAVQCVRERELAAHAAELDALRGDYASLLVERPDHDVIAALRQRHAAEMDRLRGDRARLAATDLSGEEGAEAGRVLAALERIVERGVAAVALAKPPPLPFGLPDAATAALPNGTKFRLPSGTVIFQRRS